MTLSGPTPQRALFLLNHPCVPQQAQAWNKLPEFSKRAAAQLLRQPAWYLEQIAALE